MNGINTLVTHTIKTSQSARVAGWVETNKRIFAYQSDKKRSTVQELIFHKPNDQTDSLSTAHVPKIIMMESAPMPTALTDATLPLFPLETSPPTTSSAAGSLAKLSVLLGSEGGLRKPEARYSLISLGSHGITEPHIYSLRTSKDSSTTMEGARSIRLSERWMNLGMTVSGKCLTAKISASPKTGNGCTLSDILEDNPDPKYFLSSQQTAKISNSSMLMSPKTTESMQLAE